MTINRYKLVLEYDGGNFCGWQKQAISQEKTLKNHLPSIERTLETAIFKLIKESPKLFCAGRTDAGVHAWGQVIHFDLNKKFSPYKLTHAINSYLNQSNLITKDGEVVDENFHARFSATKRHYRYIIINRRARPIIDKDRVWHVPVPLDIQKMQEGAALLLGTHDFSSFRDAQCQSKSAIRTISSLLINKEEDKIIIEISAKSFLHHMVRNIVGTLVKIGINKIPANSILEILAAKNRPASGPNAPAYGLYFLKVEY
jgi:tRNA pseudouridine38-40 synthase